MSFPPAQRILFCLRYGIGDVIMETPLIEALRRTSPQARISVIGARPAVELLENDPRIDRIFAVQDWGLKHWGDEGTVAIKKRIGDWLGEQAFDLILDPSHAVRSVGEVAYESGAAILDCGVDAQNRALAEGACGISAVKRAAREGWGINVPEQAAPHLHLRAEEEGFAERFLKGFFPEGPIVSLSSAASSPLKRWPIDRLAATADLLMESYGAALLFFCGPQEESPASFLAAVRHPHRVKIVANLHLRRVAALLARSALLLCNDTGLMHIGAAVGRPVLALFGPTAPSIYFPRVPVSMSLGGNTPCPHRKTVSFGPPECLRRGECLRGIGGCIGGVSLEQVAEALAGFRSLRRGGASGAARSCLSAARFS